MNLETMQKLSQRVMNGKGLLDKDAVTLIHTEHNPDGSVKNTERICVSEERARQIMHDDETDEDEGHDIDLDLGARYRENREID